MNRGDRVICTSPGRSNRDTRREATFLLDLPSGSSMRDEWQRLYPNEDFPVGATGLADETLQGQHRVLIREEPKTPKGKPKFFAPYAARVKPADALTKVLIVWWTQESSDLYIVELTEGELARASLCHNEVINAGDPDDETIEALGWLNDYLEDKPRLENDNGSPPALAGVSLVINSGFCL